MLTTTLSLKLRDTARDAVAKWKIKIRIRIRIILMGLQGDPSRVESDLLHLAEILPESKIDTLEKLLSSDIREEDAWVAALTT